MLGAIIGDIAGSKYEFNNIKQIPEEILTEDCFFTDDTVMTVAVAQSLLSANQLNFGAKMRAWGNRYPGRGYGARFQQWLDVGGDAYNSLGNGSAMRVSPVAWAYDTLEQVQHVAELTALPTHDHPEGIKGAVATATFIYMARTGFAKDDIIDYAESEYKYEVWTCDYIRPTYTFNETCEGTIPAALSAFADSQDFEDCIKLAISLGGDSDTIAAIAGSIAEAYYGIPDELIEKGVKFLPTEMLEVIHGFEDKYRR